MQLIKSVYLLLATVGYVFLVIFYEYFFHILTIETSFAQYKNPSTEQTKKLTKFRKEVFSEDYPGCDACNDIDYTTDISPQCNNSGTGDPVDLLILILCNVNNFKARNVIRNTWGNSHELERVNAKIVFVLGMNQSLNTKIKEEQDKFQDLLLFNFPDGYRVLSKKMVHAFRWVSKDCSNTSYILKTDTDTFVNVAFLSRLVSQNKLFNTLGGSCETKPSEPSRDRRGPHFVTRTEYPGLYYPPYCYGCGYLLNMESLKRITKTLINIPLFLNEDVWLGIAAEKSGVVVQDLMGFHRLKLDFSFDTFCYDVALVHKLKSEELQNIWSNLSKCHQHWNYRHVDKAHIKIVGLILAACGLTLLLVFSLRYKLCQKQMFAPNY